MPDAEAAILAEGRRLDVAAFAALRGQLGSCDAVLPSAGLGGGTATLPPLRRGDAWRRAPLCSIPTLPSLVQQGSGRDTCL